MGLVQVFEEVSYSYHKLPRKLRSSWPMELFFPMFTILEHKEQSILGSQVHIPMWILFRKTPVWSLVFF